MGLEPPWSVSPFEFRTLYSSVPLERSQWASLAPRFRAWATWPGVAISSIEVLALEGLGSAQVAATWLGKPILYVSDSILTTTDWRQQDALMGVLLGMTRDRRRWGRLIAVRLFIESVLLLAALALLAVIGVSANTRPPDPTEVSTFG